MIELILSVTLMFLVVGLAARWALRNGLRERFRSRPLDEFSGRGG